MTALMHAAGMGYAPVVRALLAADGIDVNAGVLASHAPGSTALMSDILRSQGEMRKQIAGLKSPRAPGTT